MSAQVHHAACQDNHPEGTGCRIVDLESMLRRRASTSGDRVYLEGGWVERVATVPIDAGVAAVVRFARECWEENMRLNHQLLELEGRLGKGAA